MLLRSIQFLGYAPWPIEAGGEKLVMPAASMGLVLAENTKQGRATATGSNPPGTSVHERRVPLDTGLFQLDRLSSGEMMSIPRLILHQYDTSPFSEKVSKILAHKRLAWRAVEQPTIMPKPQLLPLTGGYRRIPVLQIGADVYCDTQLIARVLERLHPEPTIYPGGSEGTCQAWNLWADRLLFLPAVAVVFARDRPVRAEGVHRRPHAR